MDAAPQEPALADLLVRYRRQLVRHLERAGGGLLAYESAEDLAQGVHLRALDDGSFEYRSDEAFVAWLYTVAGRHVADRNDYWKALKRGSGRVLRLTMSGTGSWAGFGPVATATGPSTFASRRELLVIVAKAMSALPERDRRLVRWASEGLSVGEQAERLELTYAAAQRAGLRAQDRLRKAVELVSRAS